MWKNPCSFELWKHPALEGQDAIECLGLVPAHTNFKPTYYGFDPDFAPTLSTVDMWPVPRLWDVTGLVPISKLKGGYRLLISHLKYGDYDEDMPEDWTTWLSGVIDVPEDYLV
ncbi:hypothetical protein ACJZ2D_016877 [Fusarium nematophilum]